MDSLGDYEYNAKDLIGHGAFAVVYKGRHKRSHGVVVAIKCITKKNLSKSQNLLGKEIKILKELTELHHENVVALLDCKETSNHVYLVMEYCNGGDLADYLHAKGTLSEDTIRLFLRQLAGAMKALNAKGIVHRDLKPQNILLCHACSKHNPQPSEIKLKIADFGFARFLQDGVMAATLCGSPMYMAPEVIMSLQYDAKADLWSIGTIVFQCLTGTAPFQAPTPQALKQFYEKNSKLLPKIPGGTSSELNDLLLRLLRRNAKDRMEFDEFFNHPFHKKVMRTTSPVPVPIIRQRSLSREPSPSRTVSSPLMSNLIHSPAEKNNIPEETCQEMTSAHSGRSNYVSATKERISPLEDQEDFVLVPANLPTDMTTDLPPSNINKRHSTEICGSSPPRVGYMGGVAYYAGQRTPPPPTSPLSTSPRPSSLPMTTPVKGHPPASEPIPVPTQKEAYQQIQQSLQESPNRDVTSGPQKSRSHSLQSPNNEEIVAQPIAVDRTPSTDTMFRTATDVTSLSPPSVQFSIGTPPPSGRRRNSSGGSMGTPPLTSAWSATPPSPFANRQTPNNSPIRRSSFNPTAAPYLSNQNYILGTKGCLTPFLNSLSKFTAADCNIGVNLDPTNNSNFAHPLMIPFGTRAQTLPEINSQEYLNNAAARTQPQIDPVTFGDTLFPKSGSMGRIADPFNIGLKAAFAPNQGSPNSSNTHLMPYGRSSAYMFPCDVPASSVGGAGFCPGTSPTGLTTLTFGTSPPNMEGPIMFFAPDLPEETLMEREHNETLAKLNFVLALVDCILELARTKSSPISALTDSVFRRESTDGQVSIISESHRRAEQLVLYVRALQMLSSSLNLSRDGLKAGRLQPSSSVKSVVSAMNERYRHCLNTCKSLNTQGILSSISTDPTTSNITADRLIYSHAIEMCQSAALDELFGDPQECFRRYQTAQILLHSLAQQVNSEDDRVLLNKYKEAVEKRLFVLQQQGYIYAYDTT